MMCYEQVRTHLVAGCGPDALCDWDAFRTTAAALVPNRTVSHVTAPNRTVSHVPHVACDCSTRKYTPENDQYHT